MTAKLDPTGLIPAYAGRTSTLGVTLVETGAHPRLRGADVHLLLHFQLRDGSSPLTRGGLRVDLSHFGLLGLIPAYAGRTERILTHAETRGAHPRLRGADTMAAQGGDYSVGSSPLTRGGRRCRAHPRWTVGLIPAYAGRT